MATVPPDHYNDTAVAGLDLFNEDGHLKTLLEIEADVISLALKRYDGCLSRVARHLHIGRSTVYRKVEVAKWMQERNIRQQAG